jgi:hypothetical protein
MRIRYLLTNEMLLIEWLFGIGGSTVGGTQQIEDTQNN